MDSQTLAQTTVLYALSTIAQVCAALVAFIGALGLYRLQSLQNWRERKTQDLRVLLIQCGQRSDVLKLCSDDLVVTLANKIKDDSTQIAKTMTFDATLKFIEVLELTVVRVRVWLYVFCGLQIVLIFQSIYWFQFVDSLSRHPWEFRAFLIISLAVIVVSTVGMVFEISTPPPPRRWRALLAQLRDWNRRRFRKGSERSKV